MWERNPSPGLFLEVGMMLLENGTQPKEELETAYLGSPPPRPGLGPEDLLQTNTVTLYMPSCSWLRFQPCVLLNITTVFFSVLRKQDMKLGTSTLVVPKGSQLEPNSSHSCLRPSLSRRKAGIAPAPCHSSIQGQKGKEWIFYIMSLVHPVEPRAWTEACWDVSRVPRHSEHSYVHSSKQQWSLAPPNSHTMCRRCLGKALTVRDKYFPETIHQVYRWF